jgi:hypothetical protein
MVFGFGGNKDSEQIPETLQTSLKDIGSSLHEAGCRIGVAADVSVIEQQTQEISQDKPQDLNNTETKTVGIERL